MGEERIIAGRRKGKNTQSFQKIISENKKHTLSRTTHGSKNK
jgi:hypothetical protein